MHLHTCFWPTINWSTSNHNESLFNQVLGLTFVDSFGFSTQIEERDFKYWTICCCLSKACCDVDASFCNTAEFASFFCHRVNRTVELRFDGTTLHPYDAMFVKMKTAMVLAQTPATVAALHYELWMTNSVGELLQCCAC